MAFAFLLPLHPLPPDPKPGSGEGNSNQRQAMNVIHVVYLFAAVILATCNQPAIGAPGDLDPTFNGTGKVATAIGSDAIGRSVAVQSDGKIIVAGYSDNGSNMDIALARYHPDGSLDTSFNGTGIVTTAVGTSNDEGQSVKIQSDGKILVAGRAFVAGARGYDFAVVRYNPNGSLDTSFGGSGKVATPVGGVDEGRSMVLQIDGKIVVAGNSGVDIGLVRYNTDGSLDTTFNGSGKVITAVGSGTDTGNGVALQNDGKIVVAGDSRGGSSNDIAVVRYNTDGSLDTTFNGTGKVITDLGTVIEGDDSGQSVVVQSDGKIVVIGASYNGANDDFAVVRYNTDGSLDTTFNGGGKVTTATSIYSDAASGVLIQDDGRIVVGGTARSGNSSSNFAIVRYNPDGSLDETFGGGGIVTTSTGDLSDNGHSLAIQTDGKILLAGESKQSAFTLLRYEGGSPAPEIAVEHPEATNLDDGSASVDFGALLTGSSASRTLTIRNIGGSDLVGLDITFDGAAMDEFSVSALPVAPLAGPNGKTNFTVRFAPTGTGSKVAVLHIANNDESESPFDVTLAGKGLSLNGDDDGDGLSNSAEVNLAGLGFNAVVDDASRLDLLRDNGLFLASDMETLALGKPVLAKDSVSGLFHLSIGVEKSSDLNVWTPQIGLSPTFDPVTGKVDLQFAPDGSNAQFYRVLGDRP